MSQKGKFSLPPGVDLLSTEYGAVGRYTSADKVRFHKGKAQKITGWQQWNTPGDELPYKVRALKIWQDYAYNTWWACGTSHRLYTYDQTKTLTNITPIVSSGTLANPFTTTNGSAVVNVNHINHGTVAGQTVIFSGAVAVGGITLNGTYTVTTYVDVNNFTITHTSNATSTAGPGGGAAVAYQYELAPGNTNVTYGRGWGVGLYGLSTWGTARSTNAYATFPRYWCLDTYGQYLAALPSGGRLYLWQNDPSVRAQTVTGTGIPTTANFMFITNERMIVLLGVDGDFMKMAWCDQDDYTIWTATDLNTAGSRKLQEGTRLIGGARLTQGSSIIWSDSATFLMQYTGTNFVYRTPVITTEAGLIGPAAFCVVDGVAYWMGQNDFFMYSGSVQPIPNSSDAKPIFESLSADQRSKTTCHFNPIWREIWWIYPSTSASEPDRYIIYNVDEGHWTPGTIDRTVMASLKLIGGTQIFGFDSTGVLYEHEIGSDDDGVSMSWYLETGFFELEEGNVDIDIDGYVPDFQTQTGSISLTFTSKNYPADAAVLDTETQTIAVNQDVVDFRHFGRQVKLKLSQDVLGGDFRLGEQRLVLGSGGRRP